MRVEFTINGSSDPASHYLTWTPAPLRVRVRDVAVNAGPITVTLTEQRKSNGGSLRFSAATSKLQTSSLKVTLPSNGQSITVWVAGKFGTPSINDGDVSIVALDQQKRVVGSMPVMVRVRKDANTLTVAERDRFIAALAKLNDRGTGRFADFRNMHVAGRADDQAHGGPGFLPWHRAYLLDLERELQAIDASIALPYWRFDRKAPFLFTPDFIGNADNDGFVDYGPSNPLSMWATDGQIGVIRWPAGSNPATTASPYVATEAQTVSLGSTYRDFRIMQGNPHGSAHTRYFSGSISQIPTAAKDPLFFLLHCNVDRLWALWQRQNNKFDAATATAYDNNPPQGSAWLAGHNLNDSLWPWNGITVAPRPSTAPGGTLASSPCVPAPGPSPLVRDMIDFQGTRVRAASLGFAYDNVT